MIQLENFIRSRVHIDDETLLQVLACFKERKIKKGRFLLKKGQSATSYFFVLSGALRVFSAHGDKQLTAWVALEDVFFADLASIRSGLPAVFSIQAIEDTTLLTIKNELMEKLYTKYPEWQEFGRKVWEEAFLNVIDGIQSFQVKNAEERYLTVMQQTELLKRIPLKDLASFLGVTQSSLSRLRKKVK